MKELIDYLKQMLSGDNTASYTRGAGFTTLYFYLLWATYRVSGGAAIKDVDIPPYLALFLFGLYGVSKAVDGITAAKGTTNGSQTDQAAPQ